MYARPLFCAFNYIKTRTPKLVFITFIFKKILVVLIYLSYISELRVANLIESHGFTAVTQRRHQPIMAEANGTNPDEFRKLNLAKFFYNRRDKNYSFLSKCSTI